MKPIKPALAAFAAKNEAWDLFSAQRFDAGLPKEIALSRVAVWSAVVDHFEIQYALTAGQITTIVDAAPLIVGDSGRESLAAATSLSDLSAFVDEKAASWWDGISAAKEWWSLSTEVGTKAVNGFLRDSRASDVEAATLALVSWHQKSGDFDDLDQSSSPLPARRLYSLIRSEAANLAGSEASECRGLMSAVALGLSGQIEPTFAIHSAQVGMTALDVSAEFGRGSGKGAFLGATTSAEVRARRIDLVPRKTDQTLDSFFDASPMGSYVGVQARRWAARAAPADRDDIYSACLAGYHRAMIEYSPIFTPGVSTTDVVRLKKAVQSEQEQQAARKEKAQWTLFELETDEKPKLPATPEQIADDLLGPHKPYNATRFAAYASTTWMFNYVQRVTANTLIKDERQREMSSEIGEIADSLAEEYGSSEMAVAAAADIYREQLHGLNESDDEAKRAETNYAIASTVNAMTRGRLVHLDASLGDDGRDRYEVFDDAIRDDPSEFEASASPNAPDGEIASIAIASTDYGCDGETAEPIPRVTIARQFESLQEAMIAAEQKATPALLGAIAHLKAIENEQIEDASEEIANQFGDSELGRTYTRILTIAAGQVKQAMEAGILDRRGEGLLFEEEAGPGIGDRIAQNVLAAHRGLSELPPLPGS